MTVAQEPPSIVIIYLNKKFSFSSRGCSTDLVVAAVSSV